MESSHPDLQTALREANWEALLPRLTAYAERRLRRVGWAVGRDEEPSAMSVQQVINVAIERCLDGSRKWNDDDPPELAAFLCGVVKSITSIEKKKALRDKADAVSDAGHASPDLALSAEDLLVQEAGRQIICSVFEACSSDDPKLEALYLAILDGHLKRDDIAAALDWTPEDVSAAKVKLQRRLLKRFPEMFAAAKGKRGPS